LNLGCGMWGKLRNPLFVCSVCCCFGSTMIQGTETSLDGPVRTSFLVSPDGCYLSWGVPGYSQDGEEITRLMVCKSDGTGHREIQTVPDRRDPVLWLGNDRIICSARRSTDYAVVALDATKLPDITLPNGCDILYKRLSPDGRMVAFVGSGPVSDTSLGNGLFVVELATGRVRRLIEPGPPIRKSSPSAIPPVTLDIILSLLLMCRPARYHLRR